VFFKKASLARPLFFLARPAGLAYLQVPKVACTSFKVAMALLSRPDLEPALRERPMQIHVRRDWTDMVDAGDSAVRGLFRFTFVRHPVARFLSFYKDKVLRPAKGIPPEIAAAGFEEGMSLSRALDRLEITPKHELDPHTAPQSMFIFDGGKSRVDFVGMIEQIDEGLAKLAELSGVRVNVGHHNRKACDEKESLSVAPEEERRIRAFYKDDFERLGYT
jgi:hypothetical protein